MIPPNDASIGEPSITDTGLEGEAGSGGWIADGSIADAIVGELLPNAVCPNSLVGYANWLGGTTGGAGGPIVSANTLSDLTMYAGKTTPLVIQIGSAISLTGQIVIHPDKTIEGVAPMAGLTGGGLDLTDSHNVIVRNLTISKARGTDAINVQHAQHVWIDHCDLSSDLTEVKGTYDGLVDITHGSDFVTVSWNSFHDHYDNSLIGNLVNNGAEDLNHLTVTYHHNWFANTPNHSPRVRFGSVHVFNNLYQNIAGTAVVSQMGAAVLVEKNVFWNVKYPIVTTYEDPLDGAATEIDNAYDSACGMAQISTTTNWKPPYVYLYALDSAASLPFIVQMCAGVGKL